MACQCDAEGGRFLTVAADPAVLMIGNFLSAATGVRGAGEDLADRLRNNGWRVATASGRRNSIARGLDMVVTTMQHRVDADVVVVELYSGRAFLWGETVSAFLRAAHKPHVIVVHGGGLPALAARRPRRVARVLAGASCVTSPSPYLARALGAYRDDITVIPNGLDLGAYPFRERVGPAPRLVWLRAMHEVYQPVLAIEVVARLVDRFPEISLLMVGPDKGDGSLERVRSAIDSFGLGDRIQIQGAVPKHDVPTWLDRGDIFLNTSRVDNAPVSLIEAMACGLCVVTTDAGGIPDMVRHGGDSLVAPVGDAGALAGLVASVLEDRDLGARLSANGRATAEKHDWRHVLPQWEALLREVVADG